MITVVRIDERLIHGQVAYSWTVEYGIERIVVVDDEVVNNQVQKMTLGLAVPPKTQLSILETGAAIEFLNEGSKTKERIFVVVKSPATILELIKGGVEIKSVNIGGMYYTPGKKQISKTVYLSEADREVFNQLKTLRVELEIRTAPKDKRLDLSDFI